MATPPTDATAASSDATAVSEAAENFSIEITVLTLSGETLLVSLSPDSTLLDLKRAIKSRSGHLIEIQQFSSEETVLIGPDRRKLREFGLVSGSVTLTLVLKGLDVDMHIETLRAKGSMREEDDIKILCAMMKDIFLNEPSLLELEPPLVIGGHLMGCADQLNYIFDTCGEPPASQYLFLGSYVNRGRRSLDTLTLLLLYKKKYPEKMHLLRGKHECGSISRIYGFYDECKRKFSVKLWKGFVEVFNCMPFCALVWERVLCVPSGLSPELQSVDDLRKIVRPVAIPDHGLLCDLCWSYFEADIKGWQAPDKAVEFTFGPDVLDKFLQQNRLERICCSQRVTEEGHGSYEDRLLEVFMASKYFGEFENRGAVLLLDENLHYRFVTHDEPW